MIGAVTSLSKERYLPLISNYLYCYWCRDYASDIIEHLILNDTNYANAVFDFRLRLTYLCSRYHLYRSVSILEALTRFSSAPFYKVASDFIEVAYRYFIYC